MRNLSSPTMPVLGLSQCAKASGPDWAGRRVCVVVKLLREALMVPGVRGCRQLQESVMKAMKNLVAKLVKDEQGGEVLEYALIAGLIVVAAIAVIGSVGTKVLARWTSLNSGM